MGHMVHEGDVLAGKYRIERVLGTGGMGVVVAARHLQLDELVAIKFLLPEALQNPEAVARFAREARAAVKIKSEHVARVSDVSTLENGAPYMVMEYLQGQDLAARVHEGGALPFGEAVELVLQALEALAEAHAIGIVHRDLKPANLFLSLRADASPCVKVLDFGISKVSTASGGSASDLGMTKTSSVMGSPLYMSPEQMSSTRNVDPRTDIWAVGVILYELITGHVPFEAETMPQLCGMILQDQPRALRDFRPDAPPGLEAVILRCLEKDRARRYANVAELAVALVPFAPAHAVRSAERITRVLRAGPIAGGVPSAVQAAPAAPVSATSTAWGNTGASKGSRGKWLIAPLAVVGVGVAAFLSWQKFKPESLAPSSSASTPVAALTPPTATPIVVPSAVAEPARPPVAMPSVAPVASAASSAQVTPAVSAKPVVAVPVVRAPQVPFRAAPARPAKAAEESKPKSAPPAAAGPKPFDPLDGRR